MPGPTIRQVAKGDEHDVVSLLAGLAAYEKLSEKFCVTAEVVRRDYLGPNPLIRCELAFEDGAACGIATWTPRYGSFAATQTLYLEDLFVPPAFRGRGNGKALLAHLAQRAAELGVAQMEWSVLDWNEPSIAFYRSLGARQADAEWLKYRLEGDALSALARI